MFKDRISAGYVLAQLLKKYKNVKGVVLAVPKGGVPIGYIVAKELGLPLEILLTKKIGHPLQKEFAIGAVSLWDSYLTHQPDVSPVYIDEEIARIREHLREMQKKFTKGETPVSLEKKTVIVIDDGIATGNTLLATINMLKKQHPAKLVIAVPVSTKSGYDLLSGHVDELISVLTVPGYFGGVGAYYEEFNDVSEQEVISYLDKLHAT